MRLHFIKCLLLGALAIVPIGCEPRTVVVNPNDDDTDTTIIEEERDVEVVPDGAATIPESHESRTHVDVGVGGRGGIDVNVNRDAAKQPADDQPIQNP